VELREVATLQQERDGLTASGAPPLVPPREWFEMEEPDGPVGWTVTADGQVYGHAAAWGTCHTGKPGRCITPPKSRSDYAFYKTGLTEVDDGALIPTGRITLGTGHASLQASPAATAEHYDHTGSVVADVNVRDGQHGIWVTGALRPDVSPERIRTLRGASLSGDWRSIRGALEMLGLLAVNVPGFPVPRGGALTADGRQELYEDALLGLDLDDGEEILALVAAGTFEAEAPPEPEHLAMIEPTDAQWDEAIAELSAAAAYSPKALTKKDKVKEAMGCMRAAGPIQVEELTSPIRVIDQATGEDVTDQYIVAAAKPKKGEKLVAEHGDEKLENLDEEPDQDEPDTEEPDDSEPDADVDDESDPNEAEPDGDEDDVKGKKKKAVTAALEAVTAALEDAELTSAEEDEEFVAALIEELDDEFRDELVAAGNPGRARARKIAKVMREFKAGKLKSGGKVVTNRKQALAIALSESQHLTADASDCEECGQQLDPMSLPAAREVKVEGGAILAASFTTKQREKLADKGKAMPDGSFPIRNRSDLRNAIASVGRASDPQAARAWIIKRARELKAVDALPASWDVDAITAATYAPKGTSKLAPRPDETASLGRFDEAKHPRHPAGRKDGGQFAPKGYSHAVAKDADGTYSLVRPDGSTYESGFPSDQAAREFAAWQTNGPTGTAVSDPTLGGKLVPGPGGKLMSRTELARRLDQQEGRKLTTQHMTSPDNQLAEQEMWDEIVKNDPGRPKSVGYGDKVFLPPSDPLRSEGRRGEVVGQGKRGKLRVKLDSGGYTEVYPEDLRVTESAAFGKKR